MTANKTYRRRASPGEDGRRRACRFAGFLSSVTLLAGLLAGCMSAEEWAKERAEQEAAKQAPPSEDAVGARIEGTEAPAGAGEAAAVELGMDEPSPAGEISADETPLDPRRGEALDLLAELSEGRSPEPGRIPAEKPSSEAEELLETLVEAGEKAFPQESPPAGDLSRAEDLLASLNEREAAAGGTGQEVLRGSASPAPGAPTQGEAKPEGATPPASGAPSDASKAPPAAETPKEGVAARKAPLPAAKPAAPSAEPKKQEPPKLFVRAGQHSFAKELFHKETSELFNYLRETYPEWIEKGHLYRKGRSVVIFTEKPIDQDPVGQQIAAVIDDFDNMDLELERSVIRPRYIDLDLLMQSLVMAGLANIYQLTEEKDVLTWKEGNKTRSATRTINSYIQTGMVEGASAPIEVPRRIPYVYEIGKSDPFVIPKQYSGQEQQDRVLVSFDKSSSTEERGGMMAVGTVQDLERIQAFVDSVDVPARQVMIEIQVIELDASKLSDIGIDSLQFGEGHHLGTVSLPLPGERIIQPGFGDDVRADPEQFVPPVQFEGFDFIFDDTSFDLSGRFLTRLHWLVREGDATVKARPKILTLDDRTSIIHLGREEPIFKSTGLTRDTVDGNLISEINQVTTQYIGLTLNIRPRITGGAEDEVALQMEVIVNEAELERTRVFEQDLAGIPTVIKRHYIGQNRVKNHRPIILGGLIQEQEVNSVNKIPLLADIPLLGYLFRRTRKSQARNEIILVVTPHILSEKGVDRAATPKESMHFDTFDTVLFNDRHILKGSDVIGVDPINRVPAQGPDGRLFTEEEVIDLTLLNIVRERKLISKLGIFANYLSRESEILSWIQRKWPERSARDWPDDEQEVFFRAAAIVIENVKELNDGLTFDDIVTPRREIIIPTSPYRISLSYDKVKALQTLGTEVVLREGRVELNQEFVELLREASGQSTLNFADFLERKERQAEDHGDVLAELKRLYASLNPRSQALEDRAYPDVYRELDKANIDFTTMATFFQANLEERYQLTEVPDVGLFAIDFKAFLEASLSLRQRARRLKELQDKWETLNAVEEES